MITVSLNIKQKNHTIKFTYNVKDISDLAPSEFCKTVITQVDDSRSAETIEQFIRYQFMARDSKKFRTYYMEQCPGLDMNLEFEGEHGGTFTAGFSIKADFFLVLTQNIDYDSTKQYLI